MNKYITSVGNVAITSAGTNGSPVGAVGAGKALDAYGKSTMGGIADKNGCKHQLIPCLEKSKNGDGRQRPVSSEER